jgi:hypothetical protein
MGAIWGSSEPFWLGFPTLVPRMPWIHVQERVFFRDSVNSIVLNDGNV